MRNEDSAGSPQEERSLFLRILFGCVFFIPFFFVSDALVRGVVAGIAGSHTNSYAEGAAVAGPAITNFYNRYGVIVLGAQVLAYAFLCFQRWVPGVGKYKRMKS